MKSDVAISQHNMIVGLKFSDFKDQPTSQVTTGFSFLNYETGEN